LVAAGYRVLIIYSYWNAWGAQHDEQLLLTKNWKAICVGGSPQNKSIIYFFSRLIYKAAYYINQKKRYIIGLQSLLLPVIAIF
jgi:hypothetical protein